jgi:hypothetical protein
MMRIYLCGYIFLFGGKMTDSERVKIAKILWERLVEAFNEEAKTYDPEAYESSLGSIGEVGCREVCRPNWWRTLGGEEFIQSWSDNRGLIVNGKPDDGYDDYWIITHLIEEAHYGEELATGKILFGS